MAIEMGTRASGGIAEDGLRYAASVVRGGGCLSRADTAKAVMEASNATGATRSAERVTVRGVLACAGFPPHWRYASLLRLRNRALPHPAACARAIRSA
jgi:hypothetical protein